MFVSVLFHGILRCFPKSELADSTGHVQNETLVILELFAKTHHSRAHRLVIKLYGWIVQTYSEIVLTSGIFWPSSSEK